MDYLYHSLSLFCLSFILEPSSHFLSALKRESVPYFGFEKKKNEAPYRIKSLLRVQFKGGVSVLNGLIKTNLAFLSAAHCTAKIQGHSSNYMSDCLNYHHLSRQTKVLDREEVKIKSINIVELEKLITVFICLPLLVHNCEDVNLNVNYWC